MADYTEGTFTVASWDENTYQELSGKAKLSKARMGFRLEGGLAGELVCDTFMYYREDGTAEYNGLQRFTGTAGGRSGTCVMAADGSYDGREARSRWRVVPGSGTGGLAGLTGSGESVSSGPGGGTYTLDYDLG